MPAAVGFVERGVSYDIYAGVSRRKRAGLQAATYRCHEETESTSECEPHYARDSCFAWTRLHQ